MNFSPEIFKYLVLGVLLLILTSLATALYHLTAGKGDSGKMLNALTWRISLSVALLALLALAGHFGWFTPHDFGRPAATPTPSAPAATAAPTTPAEPDSAATPPSAAKP
jgi:Protein of unknown function (DUF2909)